MAFIRNLGLMPKSLGFMPQRKLRKSDQPVKAQEKSVGTKDVKESKSTGTAWVYIWPASQEHGIGHAAMQAGGDQPKYHANQEGNYISIWPGGMPSFGPTWIVPLEANFSNAMVQDAKQEGADAPFGDDTVQRFDQDPHPSETALLPQRVFKITADVVAMNKEIDALRRGGDAGRVHYQLFPNINLPKFFNRMSPSSVAISTADPFVELPNNQLIDDLKETPHCIYKAYNCTTMVQKVLKAGGKEVPPVTKWRPWGITPSNLATALEEAGAQEVDANEAIINSSKLRLK